MSALTLVMAACTEPEFVLLDAGSEDAGTRSDAGPTVARGDGGQRPVGNDACEGNACPTGDLTIETITSRGFPQWAKPLVGTYAMRARFYAFSADNVQERHELTARVEIGTEGTQAVLAITEVCERKIERLSGANVTRTAWITTPWLLPPRKYELKIPTTKGAITAPTAQANLSYAPSRCPKADASACTCPADLTALPAGPDDCRVTDADDDGMPGLKLTVRERDVELVDHVVIHENSGFNDLNVGEGPTLSGSIDFKGEIATVVCGGGGRRCEVDAVQRNCRTANPVEIVRNPPEGREPLGCDALLKATNLFKQEWPGFPEGPGC